MEGIVDAEHFVGRPSVIYIIDKNITFYPDLKKIKFKREARKADANHPNYC